jgi:hypothetical protein
VDRFVRTFRRFGVLFVLGLGACLSPVQPSAQPDASTVDGGPVFGKTPDTENTDLSISNGDSGPEVQVGLDATDTVDAPDALEDVDAADVPDTADTADTAEVSDTADVSDTAEVSDVADAADVTETADVADSLDTAPDATATVTCGDGTCAPTETCTACPGDCGACPPPPCVVLGSANCAAGLQCFPNGNVTFCAKPGTLQPAAACKFYNDCSLGSLCAAGQCRTLCDFSGQDPAFGCKPGVPCEQLVTGGGATNLGVCKPGSNCDALTDVGCGGLSCVPSGWLKTCVKPGTVEVNATCTAASDCVLGSLCDGGVCRAKCSTGGGDPKCASGVCAAVLGPDGQPIPGLVGTCH